jgi:orotate phosphoribosyltransferase
MGGFIMTRQDLAKGIYKAAYLTGEFKLRSGQISNEYFDKYMFTSDPALLEAITASLSALIPKDTEILAGLEMGAIPLAAALSLKTGLPASYVRKKAKEYGTMKAAEGAALQGKKVLMVEDVVTTGGQILLSADDLRKAGAEILGCICVIRRGEKAHEILAAEGIELFPLYTMEELKAEGQ